MAVEVDMGRWLRVAILMIAGAAGAQAARADTPPAPAEVMALSPELRQAFRAAVTDRSPSPSARLDLMMVFLFDTQRGLGMQYDHAATHTVDQAFRTRKANCLSFTLLTLALAREAGLEAYAQQIDDVLSWRQENLHLVRTDHVNTGVRVQQRRYTIDVASNEILTLTPPHTIGDDTLLALYYSNRAMELAMDGRPTEAAPYMTMSLRLDPTSASGLNNAGVLALRHGDDAAAERHFRAALERDPAHGGALANLSQFYTRQGDSARARPLQLRSDRLLRRDPFHQFVTGAQAEASGDLATAVQRYRRAIRLHPGEHRFHFALARALLQQGDTQAAVAALTAARNLADRDGTAQYQAKLDLLKTRPPRE
ncbi:tetratricopeptide repeat protein [Luteimonas sp BLCC-B24]|uniref:tetratricopeptide repeat protein n=1 Tax=Luteimonas sp. BLCC-B24 TaxID=3025317 RepID=UPI00234D2DA3|nr:tetratricopeptide repeat protein [Luteimonas sp. BLCC-B24]MDC7807180.1 tetratricopeptide repeat protein [Luteimonas sp. BLCC-B24]